ncbi:MAG: PQQ-binding-like beta-propeller repeat protein [Candidatus Eremiobacterota bacterium]
MITKLTILILLFLLFTTCCYSQDSGNERTTTAPVLDSEGNIYIGCSDGQVHCLDSEGKHRWSFKTGGDILSELFMLNDGTIYVYTADDTLYALNPDGSMKKSYEKLDSFVAPAIGQDGTIYAGEEYQVKAYNKNGEEQWRVVTRRQLVNIVVSGTGTIYATAGTQIMAINPDGSNKWGNFLDRADGSLFMPAADKNDNVYVCTSGSNFYGFDSQGNQRWKKTVYLPANVSPSIGNDGTVYICAESTLFAFNPDGSLSWNYRIKGFRNLSGPAVTPDGTVYVSAGDFLYAMKNGKEVWNFNPEDNISKKPAIGKDGTIYVSTDNGGLLALTADGKLKWSDVLGK